MAEQDSSDNALSRYEADRADRPAEPSLIKTSLTWLAATVIWWLLLVAGVLTLWVDLFALGAGILLAAAVGLIIWNSWAERSRRRLGESGQALSYLGGHYMRMTAWLAVGAVVCLVISGLVASSSVGAAIMLFAAAALGAYFAAYNFALARTQHAVDRLIAPDAQIASCAGSEGGPLITPRNGLLLVVSAREFIALRLGWLREPSTTLRAAVADVRDLDVSDTPWSARVQIATEAGSVTVRTSKGEADALRRALQPGGH